MKRIDLSIPGLCLLEPKVYGDERGWFFEAFREDVLASLGIQARFVQDNQSMSRKGILRGLHYQLGRPQGKLVRVLAGSIFDVAVDLRPGSPTFGKWAGETLSAADRRMMWVPEGFAHGFCVVSEVAEVLYKTTDYYAPAEERGIRWDSPELGIRWPLEGAPTLNARDAAFPTLASLPKADLPRR